MIGDEIINVNGSSLRGITMEQARHILGTCGPEIDIIVARDPHVKPPPSAAPTPSHNTSNIGERRKRRKLPTIERPQSAPIYNNVVTERTIMSNGDLTKTVITIGDDEEYGEPVEDRRQQAPQSQQQQQPQQQQTQLQQLQQHSQPLPETRNSTTSVNSGLRKVKSTAKPSRIPQRHQFSGVSVHTVEFEKVMYILIRCKRH